MLFLFRFEYSTLNTISKRKHNLGLAEELQCWQSISLVSWEKRRKWNWVPESCKSWNWEEEWFVISQLHLNSCYYEIIKGDWQLYPFFPHLQKYLFWRPFSTFCLYYSAYELNKPAVTKYQKSLSSVSMTSSTSAAHFLNLDWDENGRFFFFFFLVILPI